MGPFNGGYRDMWGDIGLRIMGFIGRTDMNHQINVHISVYVCTCKYIYICMI